MQKIVLLMDLDSFYASLEELRKPEIKGKPVVVCVYSGRTEESGAVATANYKARELGIKAGMPIAFAKRAAKGKDVVFLPRDMDYYREVSDRVMELLEEEADIVEQVSIDEAYMDVSEKTQGDWNKAEKIAKEIKKKIKKQEGITCSIGIGPNKLIAKMSAGRQKPDGLTVVKQEEIKKFLHGLPVSELHGVGGKTVEVLNELDIKSVDKLAKAELSVLEKHFGRNRAQLLINKAKGIDDSPVEPREKQQLSRMGTLKEDTDNEDIILEKIKELAAELKESLEKEKVYYRTISIIAIDTELKMQTKSETMQESNEVETALPVARKLLEEYLKENPGKLLRRVGLRVSNFVREKKQKTLLDY